MLHRPSARWGGEAQTDSGAKRRSDGPSARRIAAGACGPVPGRSNGHRSCSTRAQRRGAAALVRRSPGHAPAADSPRRGRAATSPASPAFGARGPRADRCGGCSHCRAGQLPCPGEGGDVELLRPLQRVLLGALTVPAVTRLFSMFMLGRATIFVLHRLRDADRGTPGHDPQVLRSFLSLLRRQRYPLVGLEELFRWLAEGDRRVNGAVAFTLDDGYVDQGIIASEVFAEFDCPATVFVVTGFLDGPLWLWWDRIEYVLRRTARPTLDLELDGTVLRYLHDDVVGYDRAQADLTERCKRVSEEEKEAGILRLAAAAEVELPERPPPCYAPMSWADLRQCEQRGLTFGPHSVTHPVLARTNDLQSHREITEAWARLASEARAPVPIFCYPSGQPSEYGPRELATLRQLGSIGALGSGHAHVHARAFMGGPDARFAVPRVGYPPDPRAAAQYGSGLERLKKILMARERGARSEELGRGPEHGS